jgi:hypothetical protein
MSYHLILKIYVCADLVLPGIQSAICLRQHHGGIEATGLPRRLRYRSSIFKPTIKLDLWPKEMLGSILQQCYERQKALGLGDATKDDYLKNMKAKLCRYHEYPEEQNAEQQPS